MSDSVFSNLDKLLLQLVFQLEQASYAKEHVRQQIQIYTANIVQRKSEICHLKENINKDDEVIVSLHKCSSGRKENCNVWKRAYMILNKHEEYLEKELQSCQETTEKDNKMYKDYMNQYEETFRQHQAKYSETAAAQEYFQEKKEFDEIQNKVLKLSQLLTQKEAEVMDLQEPGPFQSFSDWALQIASLRQNTKETLKNAAVLRQQSLELDKTAEEIEKKMNGFKQQLQRITDDQNHPDVTEGKSVNILRTKKDLDGSSFKGSHQQHFLNEKHRQYKPLHLPSISQKLVQSVPTLKPLFQHTETGAEEKKDPAEHSSVSSIYFNCVENEMQKCNETPGNNNGKTIQVSPITSLHNQTPFRLLTYKKQTNSEQRFEAETTEIASEKEVVCIQREEGKKSKVSAFISHDSEIECDIESTGHNSDAGGKDTEHFSRIPEPIMLPNTPDSTETKSPFEFKLQTESGSTSKSPAFPFFTGFSTKSPGFNFFDSPAFGAENSPYQSIESYSVGNMNPASPRKDIGDLFGKMDPEDSFSFSLPSCSSGQTFQDGKDNFSFPFAFGASQPASLKGFQSAAESRKTFSLF